MPDGTNVHMGPRQVLHADRFQGRKITREVNMAEVHMGPIFSASGPRLFGWVWSTQIPK